MLKANVKEEAHRVVYANIQKGRRVDRRGIAFILMVSLVVVKELNKEQGEHLLLRMNLISNKKLLENRFFLPCWNHHSDRYLCQHVCTQMEKGSQAAQ